jgi:hypothetical protein
VFRWILPGAEGLGERKVNGEDRVATYAAAGKLPAMVEAFEQGRDHKARRAENSIGVEDASAGCPSAGSYAFAELAAVNATLLFQHVTFKRAQ